VLLVFLDEVFVLCGSSKKQKPLVKRKKRNSTTTKRKELVTLNTVCDSEMRDVMMMI
jgi:hypothetical protein